MEQWRRRISKIATSFEVAHKAELKTAEKQTLDSKAKQVSYHKFDGFGWASCMNSNHPRKRSQSIPTF